MSYHFRTIDQFKLAVKDSYVPDENGKAPADFAANADVRRMWFLLHNPVRSSYGAQRSALENIIAIKRGDVPEKVGVPHLMAWTEQDLQANAFAFAMDDQRRILLVCSPVVLDYILSTLDNPAVEEDAKAVLAGDLNIFVRYADEKRRLQESTNESARRIVETVRRKYANRPQADDDDADWPPRPSFPYRRNRNKNE